MSDDKSHAPSDNLPVNKPEPQRSDSIFSFLSGIKGNLPSEVIRQHLRATPYGLFVADDALSTVAEAYQKWLTQATAGEIQKSAAKCFKRLYGSAEPARRYLIEGKQCLSGALIESPVAEPQKLGIPYFLGSLSDMRSYIHPGDPVLLALKDVEIVSAGDGLEFKFTRGGTRYSVSSAALAEFSKIAARSSHILRRDPGLTSSLAVALRALVGMIADSRPVKESFEFLVPERYRNVGRYSYRNVGSLTFIFDQQGRLLTSYDLRSGNLFRFVQREFSAFQPKRIGCFEVLGPRDRALGAFHFGRQQYFLVMRSFVEFFRLLRNSPDQREHFSKIFTVRDCFNKLSEIFQMSAPIEKHKIESHAGHLRRRAKEFRINGPWIFAISHRGVIESCIARHVHQGGRNSRRRAGHKRPAMRK